MSLLGFLKSALFERSDGSVRPVHRLSKCAFKVRSSGDQLTAYPLTQKGLQDARIEAVDFDGTISVQCGYTKNGPSGVLNAGVENSPLLTCRKGICVPWDQRLR